VNVGKFLDASGQQVVLLGKYPFHLPYKGHNAQKELQDALDQLDRSVKAWHAEASDVKWKAVTSAIGSVWAQLDRTAASPNPNFDAQARIYESKGIKVIPVPIYPTGEGGLHCLGLAARKYQGGPPEPRRTIQTSWGRRGHY
jgi:hypothetical protein